MAMRHKDENVRSFACVCVFVTLVPDWIEVHSLRAISWPFTGRL